MAGISGRCAILALAASMVVGVPAAKAVDLHLFADHDRACSYLATAEAEDVTQVEAWLAILQRDVTRGDGRDRLTIAREEIQRLDGDLRTIETAVSVIEAQIVEGHVLLRSLRGRVRTIDTLPEIEAVALHGERNGLQAEMRAMSEELIEASIDLRDAKARLATVRTQMAGLRDIAAGIDAAQSTVRLFGTAIRDCVTARRARLAGTAR